MEGTEEVGSDDKYIGTGRINHAGVGNLIQGGDTCSFLFGSEMWVIIPCMGGELGCFQNRVALGGRPLNLVPSFN